MARLKALPAIEVIRGFKGVVDFYLWRGLPCARAWPRFSRTRWTAPSRASAALFGLIIKAYSLLGATPKAAFDDDAADQPRTGRDIYVSAVLGHLHEASMSDFLNLLTECRDFLSNLTALLNALDSISTDEIDVNVERSVLPTGAATLAEQQTQTTALERIDDLKTALQSIGLDRLLVRGQDQIHSFKDIARVVAVDTVSGADGFLDTPPVPAGQIWVITNVRAVDGTTPTTDHWYIARTLAFDYEFDRQTAAFAAGLPSFSHNWVWLKQNDVIRVQFIGSLAGDICAITAIGHVMTKET